MIKKSASSRFGTLTAFCLTLAFALPLRAALPEPFAERQGKKVVLVMRVAFKDVPYTALEAAVAETNKSVSELYAVMSRQKLQFDFRILPRIFTTPQNRSVYDGSAEALDRMQSQIDAWVKELQLQRGRDYDYLVVHYPELPQEGAGAFADDKTGDIQVVGFDTYRTNALGHELGHSLGLLHAHAIYAPDIFGTPNSDDNDDEYGNVHDLLGAPRDKPDPHIGVSSKWLLGWLNAQEISEVTRSGVYRVYAHDNVGKPGRLVGLRIPSKNPKYAYWFEYRTKFAVSRTGALVLFEGFRSPPDGSLHLLDMKPTSGTTQVDEFNDAALVPGQSLADKYGDARFKVVAVSAGVPNEDAWVDIEVSIPGTTAVSSDGGMEVGATPPDGGVQDAAADLGAPDTAGNPTDARADASSSPERDVNGTGGTSGAGGAGGRPNTGGRGGAAGAAPSPIAQPTPGPSDSGCGCTVGRPFDQTGAGWAALLLVAGAVMKRRRRGGS